LTVRLNPGPPTAAVLGLRLLITGMPGVGVNVKVGVKVGGTGVGVNVGGTDVGVMVGGTGVGVFVPGGTGVSGGRQRCWKGS
jgi:hypothetical protein